MEENDGFIYGLDEIKHKGVALGYISEDGIDWGGDKADTVKIYAAQVKGAPVKKITKKGATNTLTFKMIQLIGKNCAQVMGGAADADGSYTPPAKFDGVEGTLDIKCDSGHTVRIFNASLSGAIKGKISGGEVLSLDCEVEMLEPVGGGQLYKIFPPGVTIPELPAVQKAMMTMSLQNDEQSSDSSDEG